MSTELTAFESAAITGDLGKLTAEQRSSYYMRVCQSLGLNPLTRPFDYISLNGKLTLYARKDATDQLRAMRGVSIGKPDIQFQDEWIIVTVEARDRDGRTDSDVGMVKKTDMRGDFGNAVMKAVTKAKRRVTLSICGLGMLDETEIDTIPDAKPVNVPLIEAAPKPTEKPSAEPQPPANTKHPDWPATDLPETKVCTLHDALMDLNYSTAKGKFYYAHIGDDGKRCFGHEQK